MARIDRQPCTPIAAEQPIGGIGAGAAGHVIGEIDNGIASPGIEKALYRAPSCFDRIGALEQTGVASQTVVDEGFVADLCEWREIVAVCKVHFHAVDFNLGAGPLGAETDRKSLVRLDAERQDVRGKSLDRSIAKERVGGLTE